MRTRWAALAALAVLALMPIGAAQPAMGAGNQAYQARLALGDIPTTPATEPAGAWNLAQSIRAAHTAGNETAVAFPLPEGMVAQSPTCTCGAVTHTTLGTTVTVTIPASAPSGAATVELPALRAGTGAFAPSLGLGPRAADAFVAVYVPDGYTLEPPASDPLGCTSAPCTIHAFRGTAQAPLATPFTLSLQPVAAAPGEGLSPWVYAAVAFVAGCAVWALLVRQGMVQAKTRRQAVAVAPHEEAAAKDPVAVLEGRKRALMAALKDIELAHQNKEMDTATYDAVKADFKRQAVTVMRALETGAEKPG